MARTKREQDRESKREEIVAAARDLFIQEGYEATSMSRLATTAGVAPNTIYWYFKDKDEVLVAVLDAEFATRMAQYLQLPLSKSTERLLWIVNQLEQVSRLIATVHIRLEKSTTVNEWHERFHTLSEEMLRLELRQVGIAPEKIDPLVKISIFTIEGLLTHQLADNEKQAICEALLFA